MLAVATGAATGLGAAGFYKLIELMTAVCYGSAAGHEEFGGGLYGGALLMLVALPAAGGLLVGLISYYFAPEAKGHGVPEVMDAIHRQGGRIRPRVAVAKAIASSLTIGSGGSAGTEGPIIQIGAALGSTFGQAFRLTREQIKVLVAAGAAAGIAAVFDAPIAGVLFAIEIFLGNFSFRAFSPVVLSAVLGNSMTHAVMPARAEMGAAVFYIPMTQQESYQFLWTELPYYGLLGVICGLAAVAFIKGLYSVEDLFDGLRMPAWLKPVIGGAGLGVVGMAIVYFQARGTVPVFFGNGYPMIRTAIDPAQVMNFSVVALLGLWGLKLLATCLTLGSGGSGGVFAPSLFLGASVGGAFALLLNAMGLLDAGGNVVAAYALVGMAAVVAASTHAPLTGIVILFELTRDYRVMLPVMFAAIVATAIAKLIMRDSIYTLKLRRRGIRLDTSLDMSVLRSITAADLPRQKPVFVALDDPLQSLLDISQEQDVTHFVVVGEDGGYLGMVLPYEVRVALLQPEAVPLLLVEELIHTEVPLAYPGETLDLIMDKFAPSESDVLPLAAGPDDPRITALITRQGMMHGYQAALARRAHA